MDAKEIKADDVATAVKEVSELWYGEIAAALNMKDDTRAGKLLRLAIEQHRTPSEK